MEWPNLWAPWRIDYIKRVDDGKSPTCFICDALKDTDRDEQSLVVFRNEHGLVMLNRYPYTNGHLMVVPAEHAGDLTDLSTERRTGLMEMIVQAERLIHTVFNPQGLNIGVNVGRSAGAGLPGHVHVHIVPRWGGDTNFMHVVGQVQVNPQALEEVYREMRKAAEIEGLRLRA